MSAEDAWIAATAIHYDLPLATHNPKDFQAIPNLEIITTVGQWNFFWCSAPLLVVGNAMRVMYR